MEIAKDYAKITYFVFPISAVYRISDDIGTTKIMFLLFHQI